MKKRGTRGEGEGAQKKKKKTKKKDKKRQKKKTKNKESSIEVKLEEKKKNFDSVIEPIKNEDKNKRRKTHIFFLGPRANLPTRAEYIYINKRRGSKCTRNITASTPRLSLVLLRLRR